MKEAIAASVQGIATAHERAAEMLKQHPDSLNEGTDLDRQLAEAYQKESDAHANAAELWRKATSPTQMAAAAAASQEAYLFALETDATEILVDEECQADEAVQQSAAKFEARVTRAGLSTEAEQSEGNFTLTSVKED